MEKQTAEKPKASSEKRLHFEQDSNWYKYGRIPYKILIDLNVPSFSGFNEKEPGRFSVTLDMPGGGKSLYITVHESVPPKWRDIIVYHELIEAEAVFVDGLSKKEAHQKAVAETDRYARKHLPTDELDEFLKWLKTLKNY